MSAYVRKFIRTCEAYGWEGGPGFNTRITSLRNKRERRNAQWDQPQHAYTLPFLNLSQPDYVPIKQMHLNRRGAWGCFLYRDRLDDTATNEPLPVAVAGQTTFQLGKLSEIEGVEYWRDVDALYVPDDDGDALVSPITVAIDGTPTVAFTVDSDSGELILDAPLAGGEVVTWSGQFSLWVRFENDRLPFSIDNRSGADFVVNGSVNLIQMPPPQSGEVASS